MHQSDYLLKINSPCKENWNMMTPEGQGRYCNNCAKQVVDFTDLSDSEIVHLISHAKGALCGRLMTSQTDRTLIAQPERSQHTSFRNIMAGLVFLSLAKPASAQQYGSLKADLPKEALPPVNKNTVVPLDTTVHLINGQLLDSISREPLSGASVLIKGTRVGVMTNDSGCFELKVPDNLVADNILLSAFYVGYQSITLNINHANADSCQFLMQQANNMLTGELVIVAVRKKKWWQVWK